MDSQYSWRTRLAVAGVRLTNELSRSLGRGAGTVMGGRVGRLISPTILEELSRGRTIILVSGTNGKTTTSAMVRAGWGGDVAGNATGANMTEGHVAALSESSEPRVVLETDEGWMSIVVAATNPSVVILANLSRDQMDRANEVRQTAQRWRESFAVASFTGVVVANAADPLVVYAAQTAASVRWVDIASAWRSDAASCPHCTRAIVFEANSWSCPCGFAKPTPVTAVLGSSLEIGGRRYQLDLALPGGFNEVNAALAITALAHVGVDVDDAITRIGSLTTVQGRYGRRRFGERTLRLLLGKNPAGTAALLESLAPDDDVWFAINARLADGKDPSWLYDVPFESLAGRHVVCLGERRLDLATRLTYANVSCEVVDDIDTLRRGVADVTLVANYTAFREWMARTSSC